jgi:hypothetical protein
MAAKLPGGQPGGVSFTRPRDGKEKTVAQKTSVGGLTGAALRQVRRHAAIIAWMRNTMSLTSRVRLMQAPKQSKKPKVAGEADEGAMRLPGGPRSGQREDSACLHALDGTEMDLADTTSESDTSNSGGTPRLLGRSSAQEPTSEPTAAGGAQKEAIEPPLLMKHGHKIRQEGVTRTGAIPRIAYEAGEGNERGPKEDEAVAGTGGRSTAGADESSRHGRQQGLGANPDLRGVEAGEVRAPVPNELPEENNKFARELASMMSAIASLVVKASGRSVSNGGWLYFSGASEDYRPFRTKCLLFQETYHKVTPQKPLVNMFREWNLAERVACHIKGAEDMSTAWRMLDAVYNGAPRTIDRALEDGGMFRPQEEESEEDSEAEAISEEQPALLRARGAAAVRIVDAEVARPMAEAANGPREKHVFIYTLHGIRRLKRLWKSGEEPEHTVVSHEAAQRYGLRADSRRQATWITGPTGVTVSLDTD